MSSDNLHMETISLAEIFPPSHQTEAEAIRLQAERALAEAVAAKDAAKADNKALVSRLQAEIKKVKDSIPSLWRSISAREKAGLDSSGDKTQLAYAEERIASLEGATKAAVAERLELQKQSDRLIASATKKLTKASEAEKTARLKVEGVSQVADRHQAILRFGTLRDAVRHFCKVGFKLTHDGEATEAHFGKFLRLRVLSGKSLAMLPAELGWLWRFAEYKPLPGRPDRLNLTEKGTVDDNTFSWDLEVKYPRKSSSEWDTPTFLYIEDQRKLLVKDGSRMAYSPYPPDFFESFEALLERHANGQASQPLDLEATNPLPMLGVIIIEAWRKAVATVPAQSNFKSGQARLIQSQIDELIGPYWKAFLDAPWEASIEGSYALLKHRCTRGETPNVFAFDTHGHFGFRVRTPDHDWIIGEIYCPPEHFSPTKTPDPAMLTNLDSPGDAWLAELGPVKFCIRKATSRT